MFIKAILKPFKKKSAVAVAIALAVLIGAVGLANNARSVARVYESLDYIQIGSRQIIAAPNYEGVEFLEITPQDQFKKVSEVRPGNDSGPRSVFLRREGDKFFAYSVSSETIEKYDISKVDWPSMEIKKASPVRTNFFVSGYENGAALVVAGSTGIAEIDGQSLGKLRDLYTLPAYGVSVSPNGELLAVGTSAAILFDKNGRQTNQYPILGNMPRMRKPYIDEFSHKFVAGDASVMEIDAQTSFMLESKNGYAVDGISQDEFVYAVDGIAIRKFDKKLTQIASLEINKKDGTVRGLKVLRTPNGIRIVVAATDRIYLMDPALNVLAVYTYQEAPNYRISAGSVSVASASLSGNPLYVAVNNYSPIAKTDLLNVQAGGFWSGELVYVEVGPYLSAVPVRNVFIGGDLGPVTDAVTPDYRNKVVTAQADVNGNVVASNILTPEVKDAKTVEDYPKVMFVRVIGKNSNRNTSITINVQAPADLKIQQAESQWVSPEPVKESKIVTVRTTTKIDKGGGVIEERVTEDQNVVEEKFTVTVSFGNGAFTPQYLSIKKGVTVRFKNDSTLSDLALKSVAIPQGGQAISALVLPGGTYEQKFTVPGAYNYSNVNESVLGYIRVLEESIK